MQKRKTMIRSFRTDFLSIVRIKKDTNIFFGLGFCYFNIIQYKQYNRARIVYVYIKLNDEIQEEGKGIFSRKYKNNISCTQSFFYCVYLWDICNVIFFFLSLKCLFNTFGRFWCKSYLMGWRKYEEFLVQIDLFEEFNFFVVYIFNIWQERVLFCFQFSNV